MKDRPMEVHPQHEADVLYIKRFSSWAPGLVSPRDWDEWSLGRKDIAADRSSPDLQFTDPLFRRRLSQLSRMTIQVLHDLLPLKESSRITFVSFRGEIAQQFRINKTLIEEDAVMPAPFSLSVFNAPVALATIALNLTGGYSAVYPSAGSFVNGFCSAAAAALLGTAEEQVFVYADELAPEEYGPLRQECAAPLAFGALLSIEKPGIPLPLRDMQKLPYMESPAAFLRYLYLHKDLTSAG